MLVNNAGVMAIAASGGPPTASSCRSAPTTSATSRSPTCCCRSITDRVVDRRLAARTASGAIRLDDLNWEQRRLPAAGAPTGSPSSPTCCSRSSCSAGSTAAGSHAARRRRPPRLRGDEPPGPHRQLAPERGMCDRQQADRPERREGALPTLYAATQDLAGRQPTSGRTASRRGAATRRSSGRSARRSDAETARRLWELSEQLTGVELPAPARRRLRTSGACSSCAPPASAATAPAAGVADARICTYECTFCADCVEGRCGGVCPNCGGGFERRPIRPPALLARDPASTVRVHAPEGARINAASEETPAERVLRRSMIDEEGMGRPFSERVRHHRRTLEAYFKAGSVPRWMERVIEVDPGSPRARRRSPPPTARCAGVRRRPREFARRWRAEAEAPGSMTSTS